MIGIAGLPQDPTIPSLYIFSAYATALALPGMVQVAGYTASYSATTYSYLAPSRSPFTIVVTPLVSTSSHPLGISIGVLVELVVVLPYT